MNKSEIKLCPWCGHEMETANENLLDNFQDVEWWDWKKPIKNVMLVLLFSTNEKHESGFTVFYGVAITKDNKTLKFGKNMDVLTLRGSRFNIECTYPSKIFRIFNSRGAFTVCSGVSTIVLEEEP